MLLVKFHPFRFEREHLPISGFLICPKAHWEGHLKECQNLFEKGLVYTSPSGAMWADNFEEYLKHYKTIELEKVAVAQMQQIFGHHVTTIGIGMFGHATTSNMRSRVPCDCSLH